MSRTVVTPNPEAYGNKSKVMNSGNSGLTQQSSIHALTFAELQNTFGGSVKDFGSMNMDELLKNIWASEGTQALNSDLGVVDNVNLQKQGSLTLPRTLSQKTVDEVWRELVEENGGFIDENLIKEPNLQTDGKQRALGEMTLEAFLRKAGVVSENGQTQTNERLSGSSQKPKPQKILPKQGAFNFTSSLNLAKKAQMGIHVNGVSIYGKIDNPINLVDERELGSGVSGVSITGKSDHPRKSNLRPISPSGLFPTSNLDRSQPSPPSYAYAEGGVCGRNMGDSLEKAVERRRKRMIKNRESASRSRARKQAYTLELEAEVAKLKQLNHELQKNQEEIMESHNFQVPEKMKLRGNRKSFLRRTLTGPCDSQEMTLELVSALNI